MGPFVYIVFSLVYFAASMLVMFNILGGPGLVSRERRGAVLLLGVYTAMVLWALTLIWSQP